MSLNVVAAAGKYRWAVLVVGLLALPALLTAAERPGGLPEAVTDHGEQLQPEFERLFPLGARPVHAAPTRSWS